MSVAFPSRNGVLEGHVFQSTNLLCGLPEALVETVDCSRFGGGFDGVLLCAGRGLPYSKGERAGDW